MSQQATHGRFERAAREAQRFEGAGDLVLVLVVGNDGLIVYLSDGWKRVFGLSVASMPGTSFSAILAGSNVQATNADASPDAADLCSGMDFEDCLLLRYGDAKAGFRMLEGRAVCVLEGSADRLMIFRDTTVQWNALARLAENERRFRVIADASRDMVTEIDEKGRFVYVSSACQKVLGYKSQDLLGSAALELHHPEDIDQFLDQLKEGMRSREPFCVLPHRLRHHDGSQVWVEATGLIYRDADGNQKTIGVARDITSQMNAEAARQALEERVLRSQKLESLGLLASGVAHDFNNLLTPIIGNVGLALLDLPATSPIRKRIEMIRIAADRATALTRQMLAYAGQGVPRIDVVDVTSAIHEMALLLETTVSKAAKISYELAEGLPPIEVDTTHVGQLVMNLVSNASESFAADGGRIEIRTGSIHADKAYLKSCFSGRDLEPGQYVYLEVSDDGPGIPTEDRSRIFDPFFTTRFTGRGLGLAAVDGIVRGYQCALELVSQEGRGTRIRVLFPVATTMASSTRASDSLRSKDANPTRHSMRGTVLVVDNGARAIESMATVLAHADFDVIRASGGGAAVKLFENHLHEINGVVLGHTLPLVSGAEVFDAMRGLRPGVRVLLVSESARPQSADALKSRGLAGILQKPFAPDELVCAVDRLID